MEIYLKNVTFENDFFTIGTPDGGTLRLNKIDEKLNVSVLLKDVEINRINIEYESSGHQYLHNHLYEHLRGRL